jgi:hypothetical protein
MGNFLLSTFVIICLILYVTSFLLFMKKRKQYFYQVNKTFEQIYILLDILSLDCSPHIKHTFNVIRQSDCMDTNFNFRKAIREGLIAEYTMYRPLIAESVKKIIDPIKKMDVSQKLVEMDNMITLLGSITENSSSEYEEQIIKEITFTLTNLKEI